MSRGPHDRGEPIGLSETSGVRAFTCLEGNEALVRAEVEELTEDPILLADRPGVVLVRDPLVDARAAIAEPLHPVFARAEFTLWEEVVEEDPGRALERIAGLIEAGVDPAADEAGRPALHVWAQFTEPPPTESGVWDSGRGGAWRATAADREARVAEAKALELRLRRALGARVRQKIAAEVGAEVIDVVAAGKGEWLVGAHRRDAHMSAWPGGIRRLRARPEAPSRAHLKLEEGLEWAGLELRARDQAIDVGCAPGGWSFILLERGLTVHGVDPTPVAEVVARHPKFFQHAVPVSKFRPEDVGRARFVFCDMNGPPMAALGQIEKLLARTRGVDVLFYTIKLSDDRPLQSVKAVRERLAALGFRDIKMRHLYHNRAEVAVVART